MLVRNHVQPRRKLYTPDATVFAELGISPIRFTEIEQCQPGGAAACATRTMWDRTDGVSNHDRLPMWTGTTYFFHYSCDPKKAMAALKRDKLVAKQKVRAQGFKFLDEVETDKKCMTKTVNVVTYDMKPFLQSCVKRYEELAGPQGKALNKVATPFHEERIARPVADENEPKGVLQPIASKVLMKILFAARMARFDLLRAVQGLAARVTQWSKSCDAALHRLVSYINCALDIRLQGFIGDQMQDTKLYLFADADHAGEHDNRSTSGGFLVLVGPNTYFPLTAFSKKQTAIAMSSTESEVVAANLSLRAVGLPSSGLWANLRSAGGGDTAKSSPGGGLPTREVVMKADKTGDHWEFHPERRHLVRVHAKQRNCLFSPDEADDRPIPLKRLGAARTTILFDQHGDVDFFGDSWKSRGRKNVGRDWRGKTYFRVYGPYEADYDIETHEIREALTDWEFLGLEREGERAIELICPDCMMGVFVEDNQATIKILEKGKSPKFRHADKTQRTNLSWLSEQFRRKWYSLVHGPTLMQAADILTKPFINTEKWRHAVRLLGHAEASALVGQKTTSAAAKDGQDDAARLGGPEAVVNNTEFDRCLVEVCCSPESKLSDKSRRAAEGCRVLQFTLQNNINEEHNRIEIASVLNGLPRTCPVLVWTSIPCTGGTTWTYVNMKHRTARLKVLKNKAAFKKIWKSFEDFMKLLDREVSIAMEWPRGCTYWKLPAVRRFKEQHALEHHDFDGCATGLMNMHGDPIKKPWTIATNFRQLGLELSRFKCHCEVQHAQGRGEALKRTESYTYRMTDAIHRTFKKSTNSEAFSSRASAVAILAPSDSIMLSKINKVLGLPRASDFIQRTDASGNAVPMVDMVTTLNRLKDWERHLARMKAAAVTIAFYYDLDKVSSEIAKAPLNNVIEGCMAGSDCTIPETYTFGTSGVLARTPEVNLALYDW